MKIVAIAVVDNDDVYLIPVLLLTISTLIVLLISWPHWRLSPLSARTNQTGAGGVCRQATRFLGTHRGAERASDTGHTRLSVSVSVNVCVCVCLLRTHSGCAFVFASTHNTHTPRNLKHGNTEGRPPQAARFVCLHAKSVCVCGWLASVRRCWRQSTLSSCHRVYCQCKTVTTRQIQHTHAT